MKTRFRIYVLPALLMIVIAAHGQRGKDGDKQISVPGMTEWEFNTGLQGWTLTNSLTGAATGGVLNLNVTGNDPYLHSPANLIVNANILKYVVIRMKNNTPDNVAQLYWTTATDPTWGGAKQHNFSLFLTHVGFHEYILDLTNVPAWAGTVTQLRIDPTNSYNSGTFEIDYVRVISYSIVNEYTYLTADASTGDVTVNVNNSGLNFNNRFGYDLEPGDLCMIIQMQGATIRGGVQDGTWGEVLDLGGCGDYEFREVYNVPSSTQITFTCGLENDYADAGKVQVMRVPRYNSLEVETGSPLTSQYWDGTVGGIVAIEAYYDIMINGKATIDVSGRGFRGGLLDNESLSADDYTATFFCSPVAASGGEKGESIAGFGPEYDLLGGRYGRGAPANGGGGGVSHNSGGGGGANAGLGAYNGLGNPELTDPLWAQAWNLEGGNFSANVSSGGGRGGYTYSSSNADALVTGPGDAAWVANHRRNMGGYGGRPLDYATGKIFLGGGGGAGDGNNGASTNGARGGGMVYLFCYGNITGQGEVIANGNNGTTTPPTGNDAPGGAGGGGTIVLNCVGAITGVSARAKGGFGGCQVIDASHGNEAEGPGGGGGGGFIALSGAGITTDVNGGGAGLTLSPTLSEFPPNGATAGAAGLVDAVGLFDLTTTDDAICVNNAGELAASLTGTPPTGVTYLWYDAFVGGTLLGIGTPWTTPVLTADSTFYVQTCPGSFRVAATVDVATPLAYVGNDRYACSNISTNLNASGGGTYLWSTGQTTQQIAVSPAATTTYTVTVNNHGCSESDQVVLNIYNLNAGGDDTVCLGGSLQMSATGGATYQWSPTGSLDNASANNPIATPTATTTYTVQTVFTSGLLIGNGDFEAGDLGFYTDYISSGNLIPEGVYFVTGNPRNHHSAFAVCGDHTSGSGEMLVVNGSSDLNQRVWCMTASVLPNLDYDLSAWIASVNADNPAILQFSVNGQLMGTEFSASASTCQWQQFSAPWHSGADTAAEICIVNKNTARSGNDFAIDDITFSAAYSCEAEVVVNIVHEELTVTPDVICRGDTGTISATGFPAYSWSSGGNENEIRIAPGVTTTYTVSASSAYCTEVGEAVLTVWPAPAADAGPDVNLCKGDSAVANGTGGGSYLWSQGMTTAAVTFAPDVTATYSLSVTSSDGCTDTDEMVVFIHDQPPVSAGEDQFMCVGGTANFNAAGAVVWLWSTADSTSSIRVAPNQTTTYTVSGTDGNGCTGTDVVVLVVNALPTADLGPDRSICRGDGTTLHASGGVSYQWGSHPAGNDLVVSPVSTTTYYVTAADGNGCTATDHVIITVNPKPTATAKPDTVVCEGVAVTLLAGGGIAYVWEDGGTDVARVVSAAGTYQVSVSNSHGCLDSTSVVLQVTPNPTLTLAEPAGICQGDSAWLVAGNWAGYMWNNGDTTQSQLVSPHTTEIYAVTITDESGCTGSDEVALVVYPLPLALAGPDQELCFGQSAILNGAGGTIFLWSEGQETGQITVQPDSTSTYMLLVADQHSCTDIDTVSVIVHPNPMANFTYTPQKPSLIDPVVTFRDVSEGNIQHWDWLFDNGELADHISNMQHPQNEYFTPGSYRVSLAVETVHGCRDLTIQNLVVRSDFTFYAPNAFTPNNDQTNDGFRTYGHGFDTTTFTLWVYDRWGELLFTSNDLYEFWDGRKQGFTELCPIDVYSWTVYFLDYERREHKYVGKVALVK